MSEEQQSLEERTGSTELEKIIQENINQRKEGPSFALSDFSGYLTLIKQCDEATPRTSDEKEYKHGCNPIKYLNDVQTMRHLQKLGLIQKHYVQTILKIRETRDGKPIDIIKTKDHEEVYVTTEKGRQLLDDYKKAKSPSS